MSKKREPKVIIPLSEYERLKVYENTLTKGSVTINQSYYDELLDLAEKWRGIKDLDNVTQYSADATLGALVRKMPPGTWLVYSSLVPAGQWSVQEEFGIGRAKLVSVGATPEEALRAALEK